ncbi:glutamate racemase [Anaerobranca gottschalkii]|uniref:Glutamate racemase n=1 Tax=Anaerobranca gottschalkii DSM 13577 TaxID=1120990 RepID=A0A1I0AIG9_9FIRM|nr:glutamate racemase [Anaerobranca gottschalkii]SES93051.1 glutamate racemase [Anaerobranca gottschalkii DSM 13577]
MDNKIYSIGLIDSGVGGLTVFKELAKLLPDERMVYFGDTARMPYGPRKPEEVKEFVLQIIDFLQTQDIKMVITACNTATAVGLEYYKNKLEIPVIGVIEPGAEMAVSMTKNKKVGVIGTEGTVKSGAYEKAIKGLDGSIEVYSQACPLFVLLVENNLIHTKEAKRVAESYLQPLKDEGVDTLILGCTHYPIMADLIGEVMGPEVTLVNSAEATAQLAKEILEEKEMLVKRDKLPIHRFFVSGRTTGFNEVASKWLNKEIKAYRVLLD